MKNHFFFRKNVYYFHLFILCMKIEKSYETRALQAI